MNSHGNVVAIIQPAVGNGYLLDCYGPNGGALARHDRRHLFPTIEAAAAEARLRHGPNLDQVRYWSSDGGSRDLEPS